MSTPPVAAPVTGSVRVVGVVDDGRHAGIDQIHGKNTSTDTTGIAYWVIVVR